MSKKIYNQAGLQQQQTDNCCTASTGCVTPSVYDPEKIVAECIFVEKVYDSALIREEANEVLTVFFDIADKIPVGSKVINATIICTTKPKGESSGLVIESEVLSINGVTPPSGPTPIGPGGQEQIDLSFIDTSECDAVGKGTPIIVDQDIDVEGQVLLSISGTLRLPNGSHKSFSADKVVTITPFTIKRFARLCMPSTFAAQKPSLAEFCAILCDAILPLGLDSLEIVDASGNKKLKANIVLLFCIICEKKVKVPVQLCVLSTGFCEPEEQGGLCVEFPRLFPEQVNVEVIGDGDSNS
jgi:hypothetical protein